jgi:hypothetical protein
MVFAVFLILLSGLGILAAVVVPGWADLGLLAAAIGLAALVLLGRALLDRAELRRPPARRAVPDESAHLKSAPSRPVSRHRKAKPESRAPKAGKTVILDGSNVMYWRDEQPRIETVQEVVRSLTGRGLSVGVMFDANAGYKLFDEYSDDHDLAKLLGLPAQDVLVVPSGVQADAYILQAARDLGARIVSNDRFRDWAAEFPEVATPGHVVHGHFRGGKLRLDLSTGSKRAEAVPA